MSKKDDDMDTTSLENKSPMTINKQMTLFILCTIGYFIFRVMFVSDESNKILLLIEDWKSIHLINTNKHYKNA